MAETMALSYPRRAIGQTAAEIFAKGGEYNESATEFMTPLDVDNPYLSGLHG
jgi:hypothetical protein